MKNKNKEIYGPIIQVHNLPEPQLKEMNRLDQQHCKRMHYLNKAKRKAENSALNSSSSFTSDIQSSKPDFFSPRVLYSQQNPRTTRKVFENIQSVVTHEDMSE